MVLWRCEEGEGRERGREANGDGESGPHGSEGQPGEEIQQEGGIGLSTTEEGEGEGEQRQQNQQPIQEQNPQQKNQRQRGSSLVPPP